MKVLSRTVKLLTVAAVAATCVAGTVAAHELPAVRAWSARADRAADWQRATATAHARRIAAERRLVQLRAGYDALVLRSHLRDQHLLRVLTVVRHAKLRHWRHG